MNLSAISIRNPVFAWMLMFALIVFGAIALSRLGVSMLPDVDQPIIEVSIDYEGAAPEIMESEIVDPIESRVLNLEGLKEVKASVRQGRASIRLEFAIERSVDDAFQDVQTAISQIRLPPLADRPILRKSNPEEDPIMFIGVASKERSYADLIRFVERGVLDPLQQVDGVGEVQLAGFGDRNLRVWVSQEKLKKYELTILDVLRALREQHIEVAAGLLELPDQEWNMRVLGEAREVKEFENIRIQYRGSQPILGRIIRLGEVARIEDGLSEVRREARIDGERALSISVRKQRGSNELAVAQAVHAQIKSLQATLPKDVRLVVNVDFSVFTEQTVKSTQEKLLLASLLTALLCFLMLGRFAHGFNVALSIPTSVLGTFLVLMFSGFTLNLFTLLALALAISIIVDDSIMMLENIVRHQKMGKSSVQAALDGSREIWLAAAATTFSVVAIFLPVVFMDGYIGRFFFQFGVTMSTAVLLSLLEAVTITPMRVSQMSASDHKETWLESKIEPLWHWLEQKYQRSLQVALVWPITFIVGSVLTFGLSVWVLQRQLRKEFVPAQDQNFVLLNFQLPPGVALAKTMEAAKKIEAALQADDRVERVFISAGAGGQSSGTNAGFGAVRLVPREQRSVTHVEWMSEMRGRLGAELKGVRLNFRDVSTRGLTTGRLQPVAFNIRGPDLEVLKNASEKIKTELEATNLVVDVDTDYREGVPELEFVPRREFAAQSGVTQEAIGRTIQAAVGGIREGAFTSGGRRYDIRVRLTPENRMSIAQLEQLSVRTLSGEIFPLKQFVEIRESSQLQSLNRIDRSRAISIFANLPPGGAQGEALKVAEEIARKNLPEGYSFHLEGASQGFAQSFASIWFALLLGLLTAYMILGAQFNSFIHPITVLMALPFAIIGAVFSLWVFDLSLNLYSMIGILVLMGLAKKNSILLVEFTNQRRHQGEKNVTQALLAACPLRLRAILLTTVATIVGAIPLALASGPGFEARQPMAIAILGGMVVSTVMTLYVIPIIYRSLAPLERSAR